MRTILCWVLVWAHAWGLWSLRAAEPLEQAFQSAILAEEVRRDLESAIRGYEGVVAQVDAQRAIAATAVFRLGECYRKMGRTNEAVAQYRRLLRDYPGESTLGRLSRENLLALGALAAEGQATTGEPGRAPVALSGPAEEEAAEIRRLQTLFERSPDLLNASENDQTPLMTAAGKGQLAVVQSLMGWGAKVDRDVGGKTALHVAAYEGHKAVVEALLDAKADPNARDATGATPVSMAVMRGYVAVIETLLARGANLASDPGNSALIAAVESGRTNLIDRLVQAGADVNRPRLKILRDTPLALAVKTKQWDLARHLMRLGSVAVNREVSHSFEHQPVEVALVRSTPLPEVDFARQLLKASPKEGFPPRLLESVLIRCVERGGGNGTERFILPLVEAGAPLEPSGGEKLVLLAANRSDPGPLEQLLKAKVDPNQTDGNGVTALHVAVSQRWTNHVALLLGAGADPNRVNANGLTPLEIVRLGLAKTPAATRGGFGVARVPTASRGDTESRSQVDGVLLQMQAMLLQAGAREDMARRLAIHRRKSGRTEVFHRRVGEDPAPSLADILLMTLRLQGAEWVDLSAIRVLRLAPDGRSESSTGLSPDWWQRDSCTWSFPLEWGDVVELPEVDRVLGVQASGLSPAVVEALRRCSTRRVTLTIKGETQVLELRPASLPQQAAPGGFVGGVTTITTEVNLVRIGVEALGANPTAEPKQIDTCLLRDVLGNSGRLRVSSDLSRVRVTRKSLGRTSTLDVEKDPVAQKYWLVDGDQIEVPEKPVGAE